jgi:hypothetical protein
LVLVPGGYVETDVLRVSSIALLGVEALSSRQDPDGSLDEFNVSRSDRREPAPAPSKLIDLNIRG